MHITHWKTTLVKIPCCHLENHTVYAALNAAEALQRMGSPLLKNKVPATELRTSTWSKE
jgi:hypothetical protein